MLWRSVNTICYPAQLPFTDCLTLKFEALRYFETSRNTCHTTKLPSPKDFSLHQQRRDGLEAHVQFLPSSSIKMTCDSPLVSKLLVWPSHCFSLRPLSSMYINAATCLNSDRNNLLALKWDIPLRERHTSMGNTTGNKSNL